MLYKLSPAIILFSMFCLGLHAQEPASLAKFFYVDTYCEDCQPSSDLPAGDYWLLSRGVCKADLSEREIERIVSDARRQLSRQFTEPGQLLEHIVLRYRDAKEEAESSRFRQMERMKAKGYYVEEWIYTYHPPVIRPEVSAYLNLLEQAGFSGEILVAEGERILHHDYYGWADEKSTVKISANTVFPLASVSKSFTATAVMKLADAGKLRISDPLGKYFSSLPADKEKVTIQHLLSHTSGMRRNVLDSETAYNAEEALEALLNTPLYYQPGERYHYSNAGYQLLAILVEKVAGMPFDQYVKKQILEPLQLSQTGFIHHLDPSLLSVKGFNEWSSLDFPGTHEVNYAALGSRGIFSSAQDLYAWFGSLKQGIVLRRASFRQMIPSQGEGSAGYGFFLDEDKKQMYTSGDLGFFHSLLTWYPENDRTIVILTNSNFYNFGAHRWRIESNVNKILDGEKIDFPRISKGSFWLKPEILLGIYTRGNERLIIQRWNGRLKVAARGQNTINALAEPGPDRQQMISRLNGKAAQVATFMEANQFDSVAVILGDFYAGAMKKDFENYSREYGPLKEIALAGTAPLPWKNPNYQSVLYCRYGEQFVDIRLVWHGEDLYETLTETNMPAPLIFDLIPASDQELFIFDFLNDHAKSLQLLTDGKSIVGIRLDDKTYLKSEDLGMRKSY